LRLTGFIFVCLTALPVAADEGLWLYNQFPADATREVLKQKYSFDLPVGFLDHIRLASVRIGGGSGAFVSPQGLILTTRQTVTGCLEGELAEDGLTAAGATAELRCPELDASVLLKIEDVSAQLKTGTQSLAQRNTAIARIEKDCAATTGNVCSVVRLFSGGRYDLYQYKRYSDIRLVFAPEYSLAFFGRERDSISYLRYGLNVAFLRAYEGGAPAKTPDYLRWSSTGVKDGDLVFASGNPGPTSRSATAAQLTFYRDTALPLTLTRLSSRIQRLTGPAAQSSLTPLLNSYKTNAGKLIGLRDDRLVTRKTVFEQKVRRAVEADPKLGTEAGKVWDEVASAYKKWTPFEKPYQILEAAPAPGSRLFQLARQLVRGDAASADPGTEPINDPVEILTLTQYLDELKALSEKGKDVSPKMLPQGKTSRQAAEAMVQSTVLKGHMNREAALKSDDGIVRLAVMLDPVALKLRKHHEDMIGSLEVTTAEKIAQYRFRLFGASDYPDGTSTPRIEFGAVSGYTDRAAVVQPFASTFGGLYYRQNNDGPWQVPQRWLDARTKLDPVTPLNFVSTCDLGGGDYGSPVVDRAGELVGITFDGNLESLPTVFLYMKDQARAVHVDIRGIAEALDKVYRATSLLNELGLRRAAD
jgi:hypothetical protein